VRTPMNAFEGDGLPGEANALLRKNNK